jgi:4-oxalocrotonate tautomerase
MIKVEMLSGRSHEQKQKLVKALTDAFCETAGGAPVSVQVILQDIDMENWSAAGVLLSDKKPG